MKYVKHFEKQSYQFEDVSKIWSGVIFQSAFFIIFFAFLSYINYFTRTYPSYGVYTFHLGLLSILPSVVLLVLFYQLKAKIRARFTNITPDFILLGQDAKHLKNYMLVGIILADVTLLIGVAHLIVTTNLLEAAYFWISSVFFCLNYKPCVRFVNCSVNTKTA